MVKDKIITQLEKEYINNIDFIYIYNHGGEVINFNEDLIVFKYHETYFIKGTDRAIFDFLKNKKSIKMLAIHNSNLNDYILERFKLKNVIVAYNYCYLKEQIDVIDDIMIKPIGMEYYDIIKDNYSSLTDLDYLIARIKSNTFIGAFVGNNIAGFAGIHDEGSIGFVEVLKEYRRKKIGTALESYLINQLLEKNEVVYLQVEINNAGSIKFHEKLGFKRSNDKVFWYM